MALLTLTEQNQNKPISQNWANAVKVVGGINNFQQLQSEVENLELRKLLGNALLYDLQQNPTNPEYVDLLDGKVYENCDGNNVEFKGIKYQLSYFNYSKYLRISKIKDTYTGPVSKSRTESSDLSAGDLKNEQQNIREIGLRDFELMKDFLNDNTDTYPLWECTKTKKIYTPKLKTIRKTVK